jgi:hypothetical protein
MFTTVEFGLHVLEVFGTPSINEPTVAHGRRRQFAGIISLLKHQMVSGENSLPLHKKAIA